MGMTNFILTVLSQVTSITAVWWCTCIHWCCPQGCMYFTH